MQKIVVKGLGRRIDGEYKLITVDEFTSDEWYAIRKAWGLVIGDFLEANENPSRLDMNIQTAMALVACTRADVPNARQLLGKATFANIDIIGETDEEADADPPEIPNTSDEPGPRTDEDETKPGESSEPSSVRPVTALPHTGTSG